MNEQLRGSIQRQLTSALSEERVFWKKADLLPYGSDVYMGIWYLGGLAHHLPDFVVLPVSTEEVQRVVKIAAKHGIPLIPKGGGSNRTGMLIPIQGGIVVDTIKMNRIVEISEPNLYVTTQPGIGLRELEDRLAEHGLALHQVQGSQKVATIGGVISTAGYSRKQNRFGTISDRVMSLEVVLADGSILRTGPKVLYTSTGYRLNQLFIGAEGTLGIITEATLRVEPMPEKEEALLALYDDFWAAKAAGDRVNATGVAFVTGEASELPEKMTYAVAPHRRGALFLTFEGTEGEVCAQIAFVRGIVSETGGVIAGRDEAMGQLSDFTQHWCGSWANPEFTEEITTYVPQDRLREFYDSLWNDVLPRHGVKPAAEDRLSADFGRYAMAYSQFLMPKGENAGENHRRMTREIAKLAISLGGSVSACTGSGLKHREDLDLEFSPQALDMMRRIKKELDPQNIMNPGKKIPGI
jgi:FAD/FMN-containing dehydrogenase